jgi:hypothetical protein
MKKVSYKYCRENKTHNFFPKNEPFMRYCGKTMYSWAGHRRQ